MFKFEVDILEMRQKLTVGNHRDIFVFSGTTEGITPHDFESLASVKGEEFG
jgi:hypothetical protein